MKRARKTAGAEESIHTRDTVFGDSVLGDKVTVNSGGVYASGREGRVRPLTTGDVASLGDRYLEYVLTDCLSLDLRGLPQARLLLLPLPEIYVRLHVGLFDASLDSRVRTSPGSAVPSGMMESVAGDPTTDLLAFARQTRHAVVLGDPGTGKTTFLRFLARTLALEYRLDPTNSRMPVLFPLRAYSDAITKHGEVALSEYIPRYFAAERGWLGEPDALLSTLLDRQRVHLLLDGLDESVDEDARRATVSAVEDMARTYPDCFVTVTARVAGYDAAPMSGEFSGAVIQPLEDGEIREFVGKWTRACQDVLFGSGIASFSAEKEAHDFLQLLTRNRNIRQLATNMLLLTLLALMHLERRGLPENRAELYRECVELLAERWNRWRSLSGRAVSYRTDQLKLSEEFVVRTLGPVALWNHEIRPGGMMERGDLMRELASSLSHGGVSNAHVGQLVDEYLRLVSEGSGLIVEHGVGLFGFAHPTFEEYLAGRAVVGLKRELEAVAWVASHRDDPKWHEVIALAIASATTTMASVLIQEGMLRGLGGGDAPEEIAQLAGRALLDRGESSTDGATWGIVERLLQGTMQRSGSGLRVRRTAGSMLGQMGWAPNDLDDFVAISMKPSSSADIAGHGDRSEEFQISLYPVTNRQYARFIGEGGYDRSELWDAEGWKWRTGSLAVEDALDSEEEYLSLRPVGERATPYYWDTPLHDNPLFPVVGVTYYEAAAYCRWVAADLKGQGLAAGGVARLPSELEWEWAACGGDGRLYPWGDAFDPGCANVARQLGGGLGLTNVCTFPQGRSPFGLWDCAGNVWEWTSSGQSGSRRRPVCGGSWNKYHWEAKCHYRSSECLPGFSNSLGFRVALVREDRDLTVENGCS